MARKKGKRTRIIVAAIIIVVLIAIGTAALIKALNPSKHDPYSQQTGTSTSQPDTSSDSTQNNGGNQSPSGNPSNGSASSDGNSSKDASKDPAPDPSTVATINVDPLSITVSYVKGAGGFEYEVLRTPSGTRYVEFRSESLIGSKCTDDQGAFASILENPNADESAALAKTITVGGTKYGLSLASAACTSDTAKLQKYQQSFSNAFGLLKKME